MLSQHPQYCRTFGHVARGEVNLSTNFMLMQKARHVEVLKNGNGGGCTCLDMSLIHFSTAVCVREALSGSLGLACREIQRSDHRAIVACAAFVLSIGFVELYSGLSSRENKRRFPQERHQMFCRCQSADQGFD